MTCCSQGHDREVSDPLVPLRAAAAERRAARRLLADLTAEHEQRSPARASAQQAHAAATARWSQLIREEAAAMGRVAGDLAALSEWAFTSAELVIELLSHDMPDRRHRIGFYAYAGRLSYEAGAPV